MRSGSNYLRNPLLSIVALALCLGAARSADAAPPPAYQRALQSTGWIIAPMDKEHVEMGTCWVLDRDKRLVITNQHVVSDKTDVIVYFPSYAGKDLVTNSGYYTKNVQPIAGKVRATDVKRDLALVELASLPADIKALTLVTKTPDVGTPIHSIGNSGMANHAMDKGSLWKLRDGKVTEKAGFRIVNSVNTGNRVEARIILTNSATRPGDSGGPMVDDQGRLVGVVRGNAVDDPSVAHVVDISEVREFVNRYKNPPKPASKVEGTWTLSFGEPGKEGFIGLTFKADGTCVWETSKQAASGKYTFANNTLSIEVPDLKIKDSLTLSWTNKNKFSFLSASKKFNCERR